MLAEETLLSQLALFLILVTLNLVLSVGWAIRTGSFDWRRLNDFLRKDVLCLAVPWAFLAGVGWLATQIGGVAGWTETGLGVVANIAYATIVARLLQKALTTFKDLGVEQR